MTTRNKDKREQKLVALGNTFVGRASPQYGPNSNLEVTVVKQDSTGNLSTNPTQ